MRAAARLLSGMLTALGCAAGPPEGPYVHSIGPDTPPELRECLERREVREYMEAIHGSMIRTWRLPKGASADQEVRVRLRVSPEGDLLLAELLSPASSDLEDGALEAVRASAPFPPVPEPALCLTERPLVATFANPRSQDRASAADVVAEREREDNYIELVALRDAYRNTHLMHWPVRSMPLDVYLPRPPDGLFARPDAVFEAVRSAVLEWTDVASPGVPGFRFVERHGDADIPIVWAAEPDGDWYIAFCSHQANPRRNFFDVEQILVTGRWPGGRIASPEDIHEVVLHEMGHALGLMGHSDDPRDAMYRSLSGREGRGLSDRDRSTLRELYSRGNRQIRGRRGRPN